MLKRLTPCTHAACLLGQYVAGMAVYSAFPPTVMCCVKITVHRGAKCADASAHCIAVHRDWLEQELDLCNQSYEYQRILEGEIAQRAETARLLREVSAPAD